MSKVTLGADFHVIKRQIITLEITTSMLDYECDEVIIEIPLLFGRKRVISIPKDAIITY